MQGSTKKPRLDQCLVEAGLVDSRNKAQALIRLGKVRVNGAVIDKPGHRPPLDAELDVQSEKQFVSRGGHKLAGAITHFNLDVSGLCCADLGASTGGFTDCLLQEGADRVYAIDVGYGQLAWKLQQDERVIVMDRCNARYLQSLPEPIYFIVADLSFISLSLMIPTMLRISAPQAQGLLLIKPQFEVGREGIRDGRVRSEQLRSDAINRILETLSESGITVIGHVPSSIRGAKKGNLEELVLVEFATDIEEPT